MTDDTRKCNMKFLTTGAHETVFCPASHLLGEILWHLLKAAQMMAARRGCLIGGPLGQTEFGQEVGGDEIHWWIFNREDDLDRLRIQSASTLEAAKSLKESAVRLKAIRPQSYLSLLSSLRTFAETHQASIQQILDYVIWLRGRDALAPSIIFTYRVWGSTRRTERWITIGGNNPEEESQDIKQLLTETALGLWMVSGGANTTERTGISTFDYVLMEAADPDEENEVSEAEVVARTSWQVVGEFISFLVEIRDSLNNILLDIEKCTTQRSVMHSDDFWRKFIAASTRSKKLETQFWDFKETLPIWHALAGDQMDAAKTKFAEQVAALANADGGVLIVGVNDNRMIVGIDSVVDLESRLEFARSILPDRIAYPREIVVFHQVDVPDLAGATKLCLVIAVARAMEAVGVNDGKGRFTYPIRRETGTKRSSLHTISRAKIHEKSDSYEFLTSLAQFVRDSQT